MDEIKKLYNLMKLKEVERRGRVGSRQESSAEHTYGCLILAEYFLPKINQKLDSLKVLRMLTYHDVVDIEAGDTFLLDEKNRKTQPQREAAAANILTAKIPKEISTEFKKLWDEFNQRKTPEAKFCQAIDKIEPVLHSLFDKEAWIINNFTEKKLRDKKEGYFLQFQPIMDFFNALVRYMAGNKYFG